LTACHRTNELPPADAILPRDGTFSPALERLVAAFSRTGTAEGNGGADKVGLPRPSIT
jgi:peptide/nickel transport system ATP-binding protein/oligopeptide transport system ATP-binding protein